MAKKRRRGRLSRRAKIVENTEALLLGQPAPHTFAPKIRKPTFVPIALQRNTPKKDLRLWLEGLAGSEFVRKHRYASKHELIELVHCRLSSLVREDLWPTTPSALRALGEVCVRAMIGHVLTVAGYLYPEGRPAEHLKLFEFSGKRDLTFDECVARLCAFVRMNARKYHVPLSLASRELLEVAPTERERARSLQERTSFKEAAKRDQRQRNLQRIVGRRWWGKNQLLQRVRLRCGCEPIVEVDPTGKYYTIERPGVVCAAHKSYNEYFDSRTVFGVSDILVQSIKKRRKEKPVRRARKTSYFRR